MTEQRAVVVDVTLPAFEWRKVETRNREHREVAVRIERDHGRVEPAIRRVDPSARLARDAVRRRHDEVGRADEAGAFLDPVARVALELQDRTLDALRNVERDTALGW